MSRVWRLILYVLALLLTMAAAAVIGWFAMPQVATVSNTPPLFYILSLAVVVCVILAGSFLFGRVLRQKTSAILVSSTALSALLAFAGWQILFQPAHRLLGMPPPASINTDASVDYWTLPTGSRIAYRHFASRKPKQATIIWLHGGPGAYAVEMRALHIMHRALADAGYDLYVYDQIGSGLSARLDDPRAYTLERHLEDLSAIQHQVGAQQAVLVGSSWGATLAAHYISKHPGRVSAAILNAPGEIVPFKIEQNTERSLAESDRKAKEANQLAIGPRFLLMRDIRLRNPALFNQLSSDAEWDAVMDHDLNKFDLKRGFCDNDTGDFSVTGYGLFSHNFTYLDFQSNADDPREKLREYPLPVLLMRGECEFLGDAIVAQYRESFPDLKYLNVPGAGHFITLEQPGAFVSNVDAFLTDKIE